VLKIRLVPASSPFKAFPIFNGVGLVCGALAHVNTNLTGTISTRLLLQGVSCQLGFASTKVAGRAGEVILSMKRLQPITTLPKPGVVVQ